MYVFGYLISIGYHFLLSGFISEDIQDGIIAYVMARACASSERPVTAVAESLGVTINMLYRWRKKYTPDGDKTQLARQQDELSKLRKRAAELEEENYILKKASAFFAQHQK